MRAPPSENDVVAYDNSPSDQRWRRRHGVRASCHTRALFPCSAYNATACQIQYPNISARARSGVPPDRSLSVVHDLIVSRESAVHQEIERLSLVLRGKKNNGM